jgi:hypothetical protein
MLQSWTEIFNRAIETGQIWALIVVGVVFLAFTAIVAYFQGETVRESFRHKHTLAKLIGLVVALVLLFGVAGFILESLIAFAISAILLIPILIVSFLFFIVQKEGIRKQILSSSES